MTIAAVSERRPAREIAQPLRFDLTASQPATLAVDLPLVRGADELTIDAAQFDLSPESRIVERPPVSAGGGTIAFDEEVRLTKIEFSASVPIDNDHRLAIGPANGGPVYASPPLGAGMYGQLLGGIHIDGGIASFPPVAGRSFLVQLVDGDSPAQLTNSGTVTVTRAWVEAVPAALTITMRVDDAESPLAAHPGLFLPGTSQHVSFVPAAESLLKTPGATKANASIAFLSTTDATLLVRNDDIAATYHARPVEQPRALAIRGGWEAWPLDAPPAARPDTSALTLEAKFLGRMLNAASDVAPSTAPPTSLRFDPVRSVAALAAFAPLSGAPDGSTLALASVRVLLAATANAEVVVELRENTGGAPGAAIVPQNVLQLAAGDFGWREIVLPVPPPSIATGNAALWVVLRATKGEALWCADAYASMKVLASTDAMATWDKPASLMRAPVTPRLQLFHATVTPETIDVQLRAHGVFHTWTLARTGPDSTSFASGPASLPPSLHTLLQRTDGETRATTKVELFSPAVADLTIDGIALTYRANATLRKN